MSISAPSAATVKPVGISLFLAHAFDLRWMLGRYGFDPCDEWSIDDMLKLPDGLSYHNGSISFQCRSCDKWSAWEADVADFDIDDHNNLCGGSPRCCP